MSDPEPPPGQDPQTPGRRRAGEPRDKAEPASPADDWVLPGDTRTSFDPRRRAGPRDGSVDREAPLPAFVGHYRIIAKLGEGGMGVVYEAEQESPRREVAVKVVRGGQYVDEARLAMFQREIDTLARLKHPNIGAIYESGCTEDGHHFFAMELVRGDTLDAWLDKRPRGLSKEEQRLRLALFRSIADAVHYAHQRGVIHRDLKPSNIIVGALPQDPSAGRSTSSFPSAAPPIKILDFGLARITEGDLAAATMVTQVGVIKGTLPYMSPEQARGDPEAIDLRTDVYALGVILYELLTGDRPYDLDTASLVDAVRIICEAPPKSLRRGRDGRHRLDPDLDTIVGKALEKDADRRYAAAAALSEDVGRYLVSQPILARPPSTIYQLRMLVRRHTLAVVFAASLLVVLVAFGAAMSVLYARAQRAEATVSREAATAKRALGFMTEMFEVSDPEEARGNTVTAREILDRGASRIDEELRDEPEIRARLMGTMGEVYRKLGLFEEALPLVLESLEIRRLLLGPDHEDTLAAMGHLALLQHDRGHYAEAEQLYLRVLEVRRRQLGADHHSTLVTMNSLAALYLEQGRLDEAEPLSTEVVAARRRVSGDDHEDTRYALGLLANVHLFRGRYDEAEPLYLSVLEAERRLLGDDHPDTIDSANNLAVLYHLQGRLDEAEALYREVLGLQLRVRGEQHPYALSARYNMGCLEASRGNRERALEHLRRAVDLGWADQVIFEDETLDGLRGDPEFEALVARVETALASR